MNVVEPLHNAILRVLGVCNRERSHAPGMCREVEDLLFAGLDDAKLDRGPRIHVKDFMGMPPNSVVPGVAYRIAEDGDLPAVAACWQVGRTDDIRRQCRAEYQANPNTVVIQAPSGASWARTECAAWRTGEVVDVLICVDRQAEPSKAAPRPVLVMYQGSVVDQDDVGACSRPYR